VSSGLPLSQDASIDKSDCNHSVNTAEDDYYQQSDGMWHLAPHGGVNLAIMNVPAFLALIKFLILAPNTSMRGEVWHIMPN